MKFTNILIFILVVTQAKRIIFTRHGQRSPTKYSELKKVRWHPYAAGDLTVNGVEFLIKRGSILSKSFDIYDEEGNCDPKKLEIVSSAKQRTIMSTFSYIKGFCPKNYQEISLLYTENYLKQYTTYPQDYETLTKANFSDIFQLSNLTRSFKIQNDSMFHGHNGEQCPIVDHIQKYIINSQAHKDRELSFKSFKLFEEVLEIVKQYNKFDFERSPQSFDLDHYPVKKLKSFFGDYKCDWAQQLDVPTFTEEQYRFLNQVAQYVFYEVKNGHKIQKKAAASETFKWIKEALNNDEVQLHWYSAHDSNIVAILSIIIDDDERQNLGYLALPPFGSDLQLIIEDDMVSVTLNGKTLKTNFCDQDSCHKNQVLEFLGQYIVLDFEKFCTQKFIN